MNKYKNKKVLGKILTYDILLNPRVTEKSNKIINNGCVVLHVKNNANKFQIKTACEAVFGKEVKTVNTCIAKNKLKTFKNTQLYRRSSYKKAFVTFKEKAFVSSIAANVAGGR